MVSVAAVVAVLLLAGCSGGSEEPDQPAGSGSTAGTSASPTTDATPPRATPPPRPAARACHRLDYAQALAPTAVRAPVPCRRAHTAETYEVGALDVVVDGHLLAVDARRVREQPAAACPAALPAYVGGSREALRLSVLRPVWFTPTLADADAGAAWYRCDVVVLGGRETLLSVTGSLRGVLDTPAGRDRYGLCATASPDDADVVRVPCSRPHRWRAFDVVPLPAGDYPGARAIADAAAGRCEDGAAQQAEDPLDYEWAYEGPDRTAWEAGQTFARCWAPD